jgi:hypothetical protein
MTDEQMKVVGEAAMTAAIEALKNFLPAPAEAAVEAPAAEAVQEPAATEEQTVAEAKDDEPAEVKSDEPTLTRLLTAMAAIEDVESS